MTEPKPFPNNELQIDEIFIKDAIYSSYTIDKDSLQKNIEKLYQDRSLDAYCTECGRESIFHIRNGYNSKELIKAAIETKIINLTACCTRNKTESYAILGCPCKLYFTFIIRYDLLIKVGQYPSRADLDIGLLGTFTNGIKGQYRKEFSKAVGLRAHGIGIGSFVYLRRVFEYLIEESHVIARGQPEWNEDHYQRSKVLERIKILKNFLPLRLVETSEMYGILSKGVHELNDDECLDYFDLIKGGIEFILREKYDKQEYEKITKRISNLSEMLKKPKT